MQSSMKTLLLLAVIFIGTSGTALPQPGSIALSSDRTQLCCDLIDEIPEETITIYVYHLFTFGATSSRFMIAQGPGVNLTYLGEVSPQPGVTGNSQTGIQISYGACLSDPILLLTVMYTGSGLSDPCSAMEVVADPAANPQKILVTDCSSPANTYETIGSDLILNPDGSCTCGCWRVPAGQSSWGCIKALYQDR
jgi:hypothetical protein